MAASEGAPGVDDLQERRDRKLLTAIASGDEAAFSELFGRYAPAANGLATRIVRDRAMAEEVVQDVFVGVWRKAGDFDPARGKVRSWILLQVHHRAVDVVRSEDASRKRSVVHAGPQQDAPSPDDVVEEEWIGARRREVRAALTTLPDEQRQVLELAYFDGLTQTQVAERTGTPLGTVKSRTLTAMRKLRDVLGSGEV